MEVEAVPEGQTRAPLWIVLYISENLSEIGDDEFRMAFRWEDALRLFGEDPGLWLPVSQRSLLKGDCFDTDTQLWPSIEAGEMYAGGERLQAAYRAAVEAGRLSPRKRDGSPTEGDLVLPQKWRPFLVKERADGRGRFAPDSLACLGENGEAAAFYAASAFRQAGQPELYGEKAGFVHLLTALQSPELLPVPPEAVENLREGPLAKPGKLHEPPMPQAFSQTCSERLALVPANGQDVNGELFGHAATIQRGVRKAAFTGKLPVYGKFRPEDDDPRPVERAHRPLELFEEIYCQGFPSESAFAYPDEMGSAAADRSPPPPEGGLGADGAGATEEPTEPKAKPRPKLLKPIFLQEGDTRFVLIPDALAEGLSEAERDFFGIVKKRFEDPRFGKEGWAIPYPASWQGELPRSFVRPRFFSEKGAATHFYVLSNEARFGPDGKGKTYRPSRLRVFVGAKHTASGLDVPLVEVGYPELLAALRADGSRAAAEAADVLESRRFWSLGYDYEAVRAVE